MKEPIFDEDGYPTEETLYKIENWVVKKDNLHKLIEYICQAWNTTYGIWRLNGYANLELNYKLLCEEGWRLELITGGWSGNESIIYAMKNNYFFWLHYWLASYRGGKYRFGTEEE